MLRIHRFACALRVDHQRPALALGREDAVLGREVVDWQPPDLPLADDDRVRPSRLTSEKSSSSGDRLLLHCRPTAAVMALR